MKMEMKEMNEMKKLRELVLSAMFALLGLCGVVQAADPISYLAWDGEKLVSQSCTDCTVVTPETATFASGWYVVNGVVTNTTGGIKVSGDAHLILKDDAELVVTGAQDKAGIDVSVSGSAANSLAIFGQAE